MKKISLIVLIIFILVVLAAFIYTIPEPSTDISGVSQNTDQSSLATTTISDSIPTLIISEVAKHSTRNDCYLIINRKVYDVSLFINNHPGGSDKIISNCGTEVSGIFAKIHSNKAWDLLVKYYIGSI